MKIVVMDDENELQPLNKGTMDRLNVPHHDSISSIQNALKNSVMKSVKGTRSSSLDPTQNLDGFDPNKRRVSSISSLGNWTGAVVVSEIQQPIQRNGKW